MFDFQNVDRIASTDRRLGNGCPPPPSPSASHNHQPLLEFGAGGEGRAEGGRGEWEKEKGPEGGGRPKIRSESGARGRARRGTAGGGGVGKGWLFLNGVREIQIAPSIPPPPCMFTPKSTFWSFSADFYWSTPGPALINKDWGGPERAAGPRKLRGSGELDF